MSTRQKQHRSYTEEFRHDAVKPVIEQGYTYPEAAERPGIPFHTRKNWVKHFRELVYFTTATVVCSMRRTRISRC